MGFDPISLGLGAAGGLAGMFGQRSANRRADAEARRQQSIIDDFLRRHGEHQSGLRNFIEGSGALGPQTTTGTSTTSESFDRSSTPTITPEFQRLVGLARGAVEGRLARGDGALPPGFEEALARDAAATAARGRAQIGNVAAARGVPAESLLIGSPVEARQAAAFADIPIQAEGLRRQRGTEDINLAQNLGTAFGRGQRDVGTSRSSTASSQTSPQSLGSLLAYMSALAPHEPIIVNRQQGPSTLQAALQGGLGGAQLGSLFSRRPQAPAGGGGGKFGG